jgi:hypothetical protein
MNTTDNVVVEGFQLSPSELPAKTDYLMPFLVSTDRAAREEIQHRAYALWKQSGGSDGHSLEHWLAAEAEVAPAPPADTRSK